VRSHTQTRAWQRGGPAREHMAFNYRRQLFRRPFSLAPVITLPLTKACGVRHLNQTEDRERAVPRSSSFWPQRRLDLANPPHLLMHPLIAITEPIFARYFAIGPTVNTSRKRALPQIPCKFGVSSPKPEQCRNVLCCSGTWLLPRAMYRLFFPIRRR
jgi:hypothetical protein